jgi:hypothetical protein
MKPTMTSILAKCAIGYAILYLYFDPVAFAVKLPNQAHQVIGELVAQLAPQSWGLVLGADKELGKAVALADATKAFTKAEPKIYQCNGWFRVVAVYSDRAAALASLRAAVAATSDAPYLVSMANWCTRGREVNLNAEIGRLAQNIFSSNRDIRRISTANLREKQWQARPMQVLTQIYGVYATQKSNYYGLVNSLYLFRFMPASVLQNNHNKVQEIIRSAQKILSASDQKDYIAPVSARLTRK